MSASPSPTAVSARSAAPPRSLRIGFLGPPVWLDTSAPPESCPGLQAIRLPVRPGAGLDAELRALGAFAPDVTVVFDPGCVPADVLAALPGVTLGIVVGDLGAITRVAAEALDRVASFRPDLTGTELGATRMWRATPPPINDARYAEVRSISGRPRAMTLGRSTRHREDMLLPAKHHHDVLQIVSGVTGESLDRILGEHDVGIYVPPRSGDGFGAQVGTHLAAGQLLLAADLGPLHGLERDIDYRQFASPTELVWLLERLGRFPDMYRRVRIRGRIKAEQYRASAVFRRLGGDLLADVAAFGSARSAR